MAASSSGHSVESSLTWFLQPANEEKGPSSRFSLSSWFRRSKDNLAAGRTSNALGSSVHGSEVQKRPADLTIRKSDLEHKQEEEDLKVKEGDDSVQSRERTTSGGRVSEGSLDSRATAARSSSPSVSSGQRKEVDPAAARRRLSEQTVPGPTVNYTRSLTTVLRHLSSLIERRGQDPATYTDYDIRQYWMPDSQCKECYDCGEKFTTFRRRHHCRVCGQIFCSRCCNQEVSGTFIGFTGNLRVCTYCCKVVLSYAQSAYSSGDLRALQEDLNSVTEAATPTGLPTEGAQTPRKKILGFMDDDLGRTSRTMSVGSVDLMNSSSHLFETAPSVAPSTETHLSSVLEKKLLNSAQLRDLWLLIRHPNNGIMFQNHRYRLRTYPDCIIGSELVDWLLHKDKAAQRVQAVAIGQALLDAKWLKCAASSDHIFHDGYALYSQGELAEINQDLQPPLDEMSEPPPYGEFMEPSWFKDIHQEDDLASDDDIAPNEASHLEAINQDASSTGIPISLNADSFHQTSPNISHLSPTAAPPIPLYYEFQDLKQSSQDDINSAVLDTLRGEANRLLGSFLDQQLQQEGLDPSWKEVVWPLATKICSMVKPNVAEGDSMDIRYYVHIKRVPGGGRSECCLYKGTICTKNVAHRKMASRENNPSILLLQAAIEHQRVQNKFASLEPLVLQEHEYLKNCVSKIVAMKPSVLVVEKTVARLAQDFLLACGVKVVLNVKPRVLARIARQTQGTSISAIDQVATAKLGTCSSFYLQKYNLPGGFTKTLMFFDGCASHLGCSVLLRGGSLRELSKVKKVLNLMVYAVYHSILETSYLLDEFAMPPVTSSPAESPPNSPPSPISGLPSREALQDTGSIQEVIKAVRIEQSKKIGQDSGGEVMPMPAPAARRSFKATVQKMLMGKAVVSDNGGGKGKSCSDESRSGSSSAVGSRRGSDVALTNEKPSDMAETRKDQGIQDVGSAMETGSGSDVGRRNMPGKEDGGRRKTSDESNSVVNMIGGATSKNVSLDEPSPHDDLLKEFVQVDMERDCANHTSATSSVSHSGENQPQSFIPTGTVCSEIEVESSQVQKLTEKEENEQIFSFDVNDNDSEAEEAVEDEDLDEVDAADLNEVSTEEKDDKRAFSKACRSTILTISPFLTSPLPYFETEEGRSSPNWAFFPPDIYWSAKLGENPADISQAYEAAPSDCHDIEEVVYWSTDRCTHRIHSVRIAEPHPFTCLQLTEDFWSESTRALLADFRARGGRFIPKAPSAISGSPVPHAVTDPIEHKTGQTPHTSSQQYLLARKGGEEAHNTNPDTQHHFPMEDCLDPYQHQKILLQFSSFSHHISSTMGHCIHPWIVTMKYYGHNDITLGMFLEKYCFNANYLCPNENCEMLMASHVRRFVHGNASIQILQRRLDSPVPGYSNKVLMWSWCRRCKQVTPVQPMSRDTWHMSFAKFLEIRFYGKDYRRRGTSSPCDHSLHHHHYQYFGQHNMVASFKYSPIILREIAFPPLPITIEKPYRAHMLYYEESVNLAARGNQVFRGIHGNIASLTAVMSAQRLEQKKHEFVSSYETDVTRFKQQIEELEEKIAQVESHQSGAEESKERKKSDDCYISREDQLLDIEDSIVITKRVLSEIIFAWNSRFHDFLQQEKEVEKQRKREGPMSGRKFSVDVDGGTPSSATRNSSPVYINLPQPESSTERPGSVGSSQPTSMVTLREREDSDVSLLGDLHLITSESQQFTKYGISPGLRAGLESNAAQQGQSSPGDIGPVPTTSKVEAGEDNKSKHPSNQNQADSSLNTAEGDLAAGNKTKGSSLESFSNKLQTSDTSNTSQEDRQLGESDSELDANPDNDSSTNAKFSPRGSLNFLRGSPLGRRSPQQQSSPKLRVDCDQQITESRADLEASGSSSVSRDTYGQIDDDHLGVDDVDGVDVGETCRGNNDEERDSLCSLNERNSTTTSGPPDDPVSPVPSSLTQSVDFTDQRSPAKTKPGAVKLLLNQLLTSHESTQIETPFPADQHHLLPPCSIVPITIYDQESSSIIAYALSSEQYKTKMYEQQQTPGRLTPGNMSIGSGQGSSNTASSQNSPTTRRKMGGDGKGGAGAGPETKDLSHKIGQLKRKISQGVLMFQRTKSASGGLIGPSSGRDDWGVVLPASEAQDEDGPDKLSIDDRLDDQITPHIELQFSDQTNSQFFCGVYFAAQFQELRKLIFPIGEDVYIRSLSRCMQWVARGGKSGLKFMKTLDDRLILKQMSRSEAHSFLKFAPNYFQYIQRAHNNKKPTALAKIIGFYKVGFHNPVTNTAQKLDLLVQENLFYKRNIVQVYDLKGSMRNRHVKTMGAQTQDLVLMDENLLKHIVDSPLYIRMHSKTALAMAIKADTEFLSSHLVMDYSLLVGLDKNTKELVVGIIDFIRTFTWDKKLETFVKSTSGKMPTVVSPELYRSRFLEAMDKYFLLVPDRWTGLGRDAYSEDWNAN